MARLSNPDAGTVIVVQGDLEQLYRARGWVEYDVRPSKAVKAAPEKPSDDDDTDKPVTRRNTRRK